MIGEAADGAHSWQGCHPWVVFRAWGEWSTKGGCFVLILHVDVLPSEPLGLPVLWCPGFPSADLVQSRGTHFVHAFGVFTVLNCRPRAPPPLDA